MNNFELHEQATQLSDTHSGYALARMLLQTQDVLKGMVKLYCGLVNSGDCGCWNPAEDKAVIEAHKVLGLIKENTDEK